MNQATHCPTVLIIEDDEDIRTAYTMVLEDEGFVVAQAADGLSGLVLLQSLPRPCLILLDMMMPRMNGVEFLDAMSKDDMLAPIPVVVVSAFSHFAPTVAGRAVAFIKKPISSTELISWIRKFCQVSNSPLQVEKT